VTNEKIMQKIEHLKTLEHRFQMIRKKKCLIIDDSYNSSLESLSLAIETLQKKQIQGKKIAVIGALGEQGIFEEAHHQKMGEILQGKFDLIYCIGSPALTTVKYLKSQNENAIHMQSIKEIAECVNQELQFNDLVFLKGANIYRLWELVDLIYP
jgi:UDP-N-acetylmuramoyl-tripeptide--D-alanyl-D-alanine ligase